MELKGELIGTLRERIQVLQRTTVLTEYGNADETAWSIYNTFWGAIELQSAGSGKEEEGGRLATKVSAVCRLRYNANINNQMRIKSGGVEYRIDSVLHDPHRRYTFLEIIADGNSYL